MAQRACFGLCHWLHARGCLSVGGQSGGFWCGELGVGGAGLARPRVEHGTRRHPLAVLVDSRIRKHSCPVAHMVRSAPPRTAMSRPPTEAAYSFLSSSLGCTCCCCGPPALFALHVAARPLRFALPLVAASLAPSGVGLPAVPRPEGYARSPDTLARDADTLPPLLLVTTVVPFVRVTT